MIRIGICLLFAVGVASAAYTPCTTSSTGTLNAAGNLTGCIGLGTVSSLTVQPTGPSAPDQPSFDASHGNLEVSWSVVPSVMNNQTIYTYTYDIAEDPTAPVLGRDANLSHSLLGLGCSTYAGCGIDPNSLTVIVPSGQNPQFISPSPFIGLAQNNVSATVPWSGNALFVAEEPAGNNSNPNTEFEFSFTSTQAPVWQNFFEEDGNVTDGSSGAPVGAKIDAYNSFGSNYFIVTPGAITPEPQFYAFWLGGIAAIALTVRARRKRVVSAA